jgi:integrase
LRLQRGQRKIRGLIWIDGSQSGRAPVRIRLRGINSYTTKLADGTTRTYWYAWKGGPRLTGEPGTPEFIASYNEAVAQKVQTPAGRLLALLNAYQDSDDFRQLANRTRSDYARIIEHEIEKAFSDFPLSALTDRRTRGVFMDWRDKLALKSRRQADYAWTVLARVLSWSKDRGRISVNPCERGGRIYRGSRADKIWTADDEAAFLKSSPVHLRLPLLLALWTGQRQGDLLRLPWSSYDGTRIRLRQSKTGCRVTIPVGAPLKAALDEAPKRSTIILTTADGKPWSPDGFRSSWRKACSKAGIAGVTFNDLRGTAVTRLALAGCTEAEIATITGHSLRDVRSILDAHYLYRDPALAESAIRKLEKRTESSK